MQDQNKWKNFSILEVNYAGWSHMEGANFPLSLEGVGGYFKPLSCRTEIVYAAEAGPEEEMCVPQQSQESVGTCQLKFSVLNENIYGTTLWNDPFSRHQLLYAISHHTETFPSGSTHRGSWNMFLWILLAWLEKLFVSTLENVF